MTTTKRKTYSPTKKNEVLTYAGETSVPEAAKKFALSETIIYRWRSGASAHSKSGFTVDTDGDYLTIRIPKKLVAKKILGELLS